MKGITAKAIVAAAVLMIFGGFGTYLRSHQDTPDRPSDFGLIPYEVGPYFGTEQRFEEYAYEVLKADTTTLRMYRTTEGDLYWLFIAYFSSQKYGAQIHSPKHCLPGGGYRIVSIEPFPLRLADGRTLAINRLLIASDRRKELMFYWYETRGGVITSEYGLKLDLMRNAVMLLPTDAAICRLTMPLDSDGDFNQATDRAVTYLRQIYPSIQTALPFYRPTK